MEILLLTVPEADPGQLAQIRDYVLESIGRGLLVLGSEMELARVELPPPHTPEPPKDKPPRTAEAQEKTEILNRLKAYRKEHGLGCFAALAEGALTEETLRDLTAGRGRYPMDTWRKAAQALDRAGQETERRPPNG